MQKKHIITIAGRPGSGKSATSKLVAEKLGYEHFSSGDLFRALGEQKGLDVLRMNRNAEQNQEIDHLVDERLQQIGKEDDFKVIDSRTAWHWMPQSFKVFLDLDLDVAAKRIITNMEPERMESEKIPSDTHVYAEQLQERLDSEARRYMNLYEINPYELSNYDLVVDTEANNLEQVADIVQLAYEKWLQN
jgi:cytidylate kinase